MPLIHILQRDEDSGVIESYIIDFASVAEMHCRYPIPEKGDGDPLEDDGPSFSATDPDIDIMYVNGEHTVINVTVPTSFLLFLEGGEMVKTAKMQEFETAYLNAIVQSYKEADSSEQE